MAKLHAVECWISGYQLGLGLSFEEAHLNAVNNPETCELIVEGGKFKETFRVHRGTIQRPTYIRIVPMDTSVQRLDGYRTINVGWRGDEKMCQKIAEHLVLALREIKQDFIAVVHIIAEIGGILTSPPNIIDLEDASDALIATGHTIEQPEPTSDDLKSMAMTLAGPEHEVGAVVSFPAGRSGTFAELEAKDAQEKPEDLSNTDMNEPHSYETNHENVDGAAKES